MRKSIFLDIFSCKQGRFARTAAIIAENNVLFIRWQPYDWFMSWCSTEDRHEKAYSGNFLKEQSSQN